VLLLRSPRGVHLGPVDSIPGISHQVIQRFYSDYYRFTAIELKGFSAIFRGQAGSWRDHPVVRKQIPIPLLQLLNLAVVKRTAERLLFQHSKWFIASQLTCADSIDDAKQQERRRASIDTAILFPVGYADLAMSRYSSIASIVRLFTSE